MASSIRRLRPDELAQDGFPMEPIKVSFLADSRWDSWRLPYDGRWFAECPKLLGYFGYGGTPEDALHALRSAFSMDSICRIARLKVPSPATIQKLYKKLQDLGGADAASEAMKPNGKKLGVNQNELFSLRSELKMVREMCETLNYTKIQIDEQISIDDEAINFWVEAKTGTGFFASPHARHGIARGQIREFLRHRL